MKEFILLQKQTTNEAVSPRTVKGMPTHELGTVYSWLNSKKKEDKNFSKMADGYYKNYFDLTRSELRNRAQKGEESAKRFLNDRSTTTTKTTSRRVSPSPSSKKKQTLSNKILRMLKQRMKQ